MSAGGRCLYLSSSSYYYPFLGGVSRKFGNEGERDHRNEALMSYLRRLSSNCSRYQQRVGSCRGHGGGWLVQPSSIFLEVRDREVYSVLSISFHSFKPEDRC